MSDFVLHHKHFFILIFSLWIAGLSESSRLSFLKDQIFHCFISAMSPSLTILSKLVNLKSNFLIFLFFPCNNYQEDVLIEFVEFLYSEILNFGFHLQFSKLTILEVRVILKLLLRVAWIFHPLESSSRDISRMPQFLNYESATLISRFISLLVLLENN